MPRPGRAVTAPAQPLPDPLHDLDAVERAARTFVETHRRSREPIVLAVSGGCDSMVLMYAVAAAMNGGGSTDGRGAARVLTFDHGTGAAATAAARLVDREGTRLGFDVRVGSASMPGANEAEWRAARWRFFRDAAWPGSRIATAHTCDDHLETVVMRAMRGSGARGLAGLGAVSRDVVRPLLGLSRGTVRAYGNSRDVPFVEDPSNTSRAYLRNRVRLDLLPAIARVRPRFAAEMRAVSERAGAWRVEVEALAQKVV
jgi:tRNA(Ile)-lysidine synthase